MSILGTLEVGTKFVFQSTGHSQGDLEYSEPNPEPSYFCTCLGHGKTEDGEAETAFASPDGREIMIGSDVGIDIVPESTPQWSADDPKIPFIPGRPLKWKPINIDGEWWNGDGSLIKRCKETNASVKEVSEWEDPPELSEEMQWSNISIIDSGYFEGYDSEREMKFSARFDLFIIRKAWEAGIDYEAEVDGFGEDEGTMGDWSAIRDSSNEAVARMFQKAINYFFAPRGMSMYEGDLRKRHDERIRERR